ncbi:hypothetical protein SDC9_155243 [bioreactor metagenome]|uniref:Uncharacterized protein n=1 Tax=bioreactor metagenome TaxID=1076179 RepID=A0A645F0W7_9ZZZZ
MDDYALAAAFDEIHQLAEIGEGKFAEVLGADDGARRHRFGDGRRKADIHRGRGISLHRFQRYAAETVDRLGVFLEHAESLIHAHEEEGVGKSADDAAGAADLALDLVEQVFHRLKLHGEPSVLIGIGRRKRADFAHIGDRRLLEVGGVVLGKLYLRTHRLGPWEKVGEDTDAVIAETTVRGDLRLREDLGVAVELGYFTAVYAGHPVRHIGIAGQAIRLKPLRYRRAPFGGGHLIQHKKSPPLNQRFPFYETFIRPGEGP